MLAVLGIVIACTSFFLIYPSVYNKQQSMMTNFGLLGQVTTVIIPQGAEDQSSGKNYDPQYIRVIIGVNNTVKWINDGHTMNSIVADNSSDPDFYDVTNRFSAIMGNAKMPNFLKPGESFEYTFTKPGYFGYHGEPHPWQRGWILVLTPDQSDKQIPEHIDLGASGLHDTYAVGQKIDFTIELSGYGITCPVPNVVIQRPDGHIVWHANHTTITSCDPQRGGFRIQYKLSDGFGVPAINETGSYVMGVSYDNQIMNLPFVVVPTTSDIKNLSESLPQYLKQENQTAFISSNCRGKEIPEHQHSSLVVLLMNPNSTATVCTTYQFYSDWDSYPNKFIYGGGIAHFGLNLGPKFNVTATPSLLNITNASENGTFSVLYKISSAIDSKGIYDYSIPWDACEQYPLAIGYAGSSLKKSDFSLEVLLERPCYNVIFHVASNKIVSGMDYTEVNVSGP